MESSIKEILLFLFVGAFAGYFYWIALLGFTSFMYIDLTKEKGVNKLIVLFGHTFIVPTIPLMLLGLYGVYRLLTGDLPVWFFIGSLWPVAIMLHEAMINKKIPNDAESDNGG